MTLIKDTLERIIQIYERNIGRQNEKLADIPLVARRALATLTTPAPGRDELARIIASKCFDPTDFYMGGGPIFKTSDWKAAKEAADAILSALPVAPVVDEPTSPMIDAGVAFALNVSLSGEYRWSQYVADLYKTMRKAAIRAGGGER